jgi:hypothetical protein
MRVKQFKITNESSILKERPSVQYAVIEISAYHFVAREERAPVLAKARWAKDAGPMSDGLEKSNTASARAANTPKPAAAAKNTAPTESFE